MTVTQAENTEMKDKVYYTLNFWTKDKCMGDEYLNIFWKKENAKRVLKKLSETGLYKCIVLRKHEVWLRDATNELSISSPIEKWEV